MPKSQKTQFLDTARTQQFPHITELNPLEKEALIVCIAISRM